MKIPCLKINQSGKEMFLLGLKVRTLFEQFRTEADIQTKENPKGYQRKPSPQRAKAFLRYLDKENGISPNSILINYRGNLKFEPIQDNFGLINIPNNSKLWEVDGQHRSLGFKKGIEAGIEKIKNFEAPIILMSEEEQYKEALQFFIINETQKKVKTDLAQTFLLRIEEEGENVLNLPREISRGIEWNPKALRTTYILNEEKGGPWYKRVQLPNETKAETIITQNAFINSLAPIFRDENFSFSFSEKEIAKIISTFWQAIRQLCPEAFEHPKEYVLQKTTGTFVLHKLMLRIINISRNKENKVTVGSIKEVLTKLREYFNSDYWLSNGPAGQKGTNQKAFSLFAKEINDKIDTLEIKRKGRPFEI